MIGMIFWGFYWLLKITVKLTVALMWAMVVLFIGVFWCFAAIIQACARQPVTPFPPSISRTSGQILRWLI